jgi:hypothetical protein
VLSKWYKYKKKAIELRKSGKSIRDVEKALNISRSTLSGWFKNVILSEKQTKILNLKSRKSLKKARIEAVKWHNQQKRQRLEEAKKQAEVVLSQFNIRDKNLIELALAMLYLGEGDKTNITSMANSNPLIVEFFISSLDTIYGIKKSSLKAELHLRSDQDSSNMIDHWSKVLDMNKDQFRAVNDKRIAKSKTFTTYKGVCVIRGGGVRIQRRLLFISTLFCDRINGELRTRSSVG